MVDARICDRTGRVTSVVVVVVRDEPWVSRQDGDSSGYGTTDWSPGSWWVNGPGGGGDDRRFIRWTFGV